MFSLNEDAFDGGVFRAVLDINHFSYTGRVDDHYVSEPIQVHARALKYANRLQRFRPADPGMRPMLTGRDVAEAAYAAMAIYSMECYGFTYTYLARMAWPGVANLVREASSDIRDDVGEARQRLQRRIYEASEMAQLVRFSELVETAKSLRGRIGDAPASSRGWLHDRAWTGIHNYYELQAWVDHAAAMINGMHELFAPGATVLAHSRRRMDALLVELGERAKVRQARRAERARLAAEAAAADATADAGQTVAYIDADEGVTAVGGLEGGFA